MLSRLVCTGRPVIQSQLPITGLEVLERPRLYEVNNGRQTKHDLKSTTGAETVGHVWIEADLLVLPLRTSMTNALCPLNVPLQMPCSLPVWT